MKSTRNHTLVFLFLSIMLYFSCQRKIEYGPDIYVPDTGFKVVGYISGWNFGEIDSIEIQKLTYLNLAFGNPDMEGNLLFDGGFEVDPIVKKGHDAGLKVYISLAGGGRPDTTIWKAVLEKETRSGFIAKLVEYVDSHNMDGIDVDIEGNLLPYIRERYNPFVVELREALHARGKGMTAALGATRIHETISQEALEAYDFINVMVYDKTGIWRPENIGPHSPYSFAEDAMKFWLEEKKIPAGRITLGVPFYGFDFTPKARYIDYSEIIQNDPALAYVDSTGMRYYNGIPMIVRKVELAKNLKLGGVMIWEIASDTRGDLSLLRALDQAVKLDGCEAKIFYKDEDGDGFGTITKPMTACEAPAGYVAKGGDKDDSNNRIHP